VGKVITVSKNKTSEASPLGRFSIEQLGPALYPSPLERAVEFSFIRDEDRIAMSPIVGKTHPLSLGGGTASPILDDESFEIAGPRSKIFFNPPKCKAAIVTCGGLCPGINAVVRSLVLLLWYRYNCRQVVGIRYGYNGLSDDAEPPIDLNPEIVSDIHHDGGTLLGSSRGAPSVETMVDYLDKNGIQMLFTIGGDGTMRGASLLWEEVKRRGLKIAIVSLPKTIDNDIPFVRRSFGFETAVATATHAVHSAHVEATGVPLGIGLVKLMGRHAGYIAATACLATGHANLCLIPEVPFDLEGENGILALLENRVNQRRHAVVVVAEGAGQKYVLQGGNQKDASGNAKLGDIGHFLRDRINRHFIEKKMDVTLKYIDPSYMIRSAAAHPNDQLHCARLAQNAVHAAMAGKSGLLIGYWHGLMTHVPTKALNGINQRVNPKGELWFNVLEMTGQPTHLTGS
jgi:6-phosphofructokinase 1